MGKFKKKGTGKGSKPGRPVNPNTQEYKDDPKEYSRKSSAKNRGKEIPVKTRKSPSQKEEPVAGGSGRRGRPCNSPSGPQSPATKKTKAQQGMKRKRLSEKRSRAVSMRRDRQRKEVIDSEDSSEENEEEKKASKE